MQIQKAREILEALVNGVDPTTGHELPASTVMGSADVVRALVIGVDALKDIVARASRRKQLPRNIGKSWSKEEVDRLIAERKAGKPLEEIASDHGRTPRAIEARLEILGLITPDERTTVDRFGPKGQSGGRVTLDARPKGARRAKTSRASHD